MNEYSYSLQDSDYVIAERNFVTDDRSTLRFHKGDIIRLQAMDGLEKGETLSYMQQESSYLMSDSVIRVLVCLRVSSRLQLRLRGEEEGGVFGGAEKRHSRLWWVFIKSLMQNGHCKMIIHTVALRDLPAWRCDGVLSQDKIRCRWSWRCLQHSENDVSEFSDGRWRFNLKKYWFMSFLESTKDEMWSQMRCHIIPSFSRYQRE